MSIKFPVLCEWKFLIEMNNFFNSQRWWTTPYIHYIHCTRHAHITQIHFISMNVHCAWLLSQTNIFVKSKLDIFSTIGVEKKFVFKNISQMRSQNTKHNIYIINTRQHVCVCCVVKTSKFVDGKYYACCCKIK